MKKLLSLGGNYYQKTMVQEARRMGIYVIDVDYLPENPAHKIANEYHNVSILDKEKVLDIAKSSHIDGIISYASDVGALTAAYVAEKMGLPTNPYKTIELMTRKDLFHPFLKEKGFITPELRNLTNLDELKLFVREYGSVIVKPVNSSGSKGVSIINQISQIENAWNYAQKYALDNRIIAEQFIEKKGYQVSGDIFVIDGVVKNWGFANAHRDMNCNPLVPIGDSFPLFIDSSHLNMLKKEIQRALNVLGFRNGPVNVEVIFDKEDRPIIVELGPRSGGGLLADIIYMCSGVDIIPNCIRCALGMECSGIADLKMQRNIAAYSFHSNTDGIFNKLEIDNVLKKKILQINYFIKSGEQVYKCNDSGKAIAIAICEFDTQNEMLEMMDNMNDFYKIILKD